MTEEEYLFPSPEHHFNCIVDLMLFPSEAPLRKAKKTKRKKVK